MATRHKDNDKRIALLNATLSLVNDHGFHAAPMSKIARLAGVSPATIYIYFENKQDLINQLYLETKASFSRVAFYGYSSDLPVKKGFETIWYNIANYKLNQIQEAMFLSQCENTPMIDEQSRLAGLKHLQPLLDLWERGQQEGIIKPVSHYLLYANTIYPLAFLMTMQQKEVYRLDEESLKNTFLLAWDSIKV